MDKIRVKHLSGKRGLIIKRWDNGLVLVLWDGDAYPTFIQVYPRQLIAA